jgi:hypothetical protein
MRTGASRWLLCQPKLGAGPASFLLVVGQLFTVDKAGRSERNVFNCKQVAFHGGLSLNRKSYLKDSLLPVKKMFDMYES